MKWNIFGREVIIVDQDQCAWLVFTLTHSYKYNTNPPIFFFQSIVFYLHLLSMSVKSATFCKVCQFIRQSDVTFPNKETYCDSEMLHVCLKSRANIDLIEQIRWWHIQFCGAITQCFSTLHTKINICLVCRVSL